MKNSRLRQFTYSFRSKTGPSWGLDISLNLTYFLLNKKLYTICTHTHTHYKGNKINYCDIINCLNHNLFKDDMYCPIPKDVYFVACPLQPDDRSHSSFAILTPRRLLDVQHGPWCHTYDSLSFWNALVFFVNCA